MLVVVETNGIGRLIHVPLSTSDRLPEPGADITLFTILHVREDSLDLFGFATREERKVFEILITVPGIGPKVALRVLSGIALPDLRRAVATQDHALLTGVPGIGRKLAERLLIELKSHLENLPVVAETGKTGDSQVFSDAVEALVILGYKRHHAATTVNKILKEKKAASVESVIREALKYL